MKRLLYKSNQITIIRVLLIPIFVWFLTSEMPYKDYFAAFVFIMLSLSDGLDGYIARKRNEITSIGKIIDPISDKLLTGTALIFLVIIDKLPAWMAIVIIAREIIITAIRMIALTKKIVISASGLGKAKTFSQIVAIIMLIINFPGGWWVMLLAVTISSISGIDYIIKASHKLEERIINLPNIITAARFALIPLYLVLVFRGSLDKALLLFIILGVSDKLDGLFAKMTKQQTSFGKIFDSFTDWSLILGSFLAFFLTNLLHPIWFIVMVIPSFVNSIIKLLYLKKDRDVVLVPIAQSAVAITYLTIAIVLFDYTYKYWFLGLMISLIYVAMFRYLYLAWIRFNKIKKKKN